ncbi:MAG: YqgE/AlgH family protein [Bacteroides sp.]|nr:YqgE/AlgH family protein [Bacteroides sp.]
MENNEKRQRPTIRHGQVLVASPLLTDPNFRRSAVIVLEEDSSHGHIGLVLNRELDLTLKDICDMPGPGAELKVFNGGPVDLQRLFWLHDLGPEVLPGAMEILPGLYVGGDYNALINESASGHSLPGIIRFYLGYSGWGAAQLEREIEAGAWGVVENVLDPRELIETGGMEMWYALVRRLGSRYRHWSMIPSDPNLN